MLYVVQALSGNHILWVLKYHPQSSRHHITGNEEVDTYCSTPRKVFDGTKEEWPQYTERVRHFSPANALTEGAKNNRFFFPSLVLPPTNYSKQLVFLSLIGPSTYKLLSNLLAPTKPGDMSYNDLVKTLLAHYCPTPSELVWRHKFYSRSRKSGETVPKFVSEVNSIAEYCILGATLDVMFWDGLVCGINNSQIQKRLLSEKTWSIRMHWSSPLKLRLWA